MYEKLISRLKKGCKTVRHSTHFTRRLSSKTNQNKEAEKSKDNNENKATNSSVTTLATTALTPCCSKTQATVSPLWGTPRDDVTSHAWFGLLNSRDYKNWLKVGLALRSACDHVAPVLNEIVNNFHAGLLNKYGNKPLFGDNGRPDSETLLYWMDEIHQIHRHKLSFKQIKRVSDVTVWTSRDGAWEIARVFMSRGFRTGGGNDAGAFDCSALFNFMYRCRLLEDYIGNFDNVRQILQIRNNTMHSSKLEFNNEQLNSQFQSILNFFNDFKVPGEMSKNACNNLEQLKEMDFDIIATAQSTLNFLDSEHKNPRLNPNPSGDILTLTSLREIVTKILQLPNVEVNVDTKEVVSQINFLDSWKQSFEKQADSRLKDLAEKINKVERSLEMANKKRNDVTSLNNDVTYKKISPKKRRRRKRQRNPHPAGYNDATMTSRNYQIWDDNVSYDVNFSTTDESDCSEDLFTANYDVKEKVSSQQSIPENLHPKRSLSDTFVTSSTHISPWCKGSSLFSTGKANVKGLFSEAETNLSDFNVSWRSYLHTGSGKDGDTSDGEEGKKRKSEDDHESVNKKKKADDQPDPFKSELGNTQEIIEQKLNELQRKEGKKQAGKSENGEAFQYRLKAYLNCQTNNPGCRYEHKEEGGKHFCTVHFQSDFTVVTLQPQPTIKEAQEEAAHRALSWFGINHVAAKNAPTVLQSYCDLVGYPPHYVACEAPSKLFFSVIQLLNNNTVAFMDNFNSHSLYIEGSYKSEEYDKESAEGIVAKTVLQDANIDPAKVSDYKRALNDLCLVEGGTLPTYKTEETRNRGRVYYVTTVKSFNRNQLKDTGSNTPQREGLSQADLYMAGIPWADVVEANSDQPQRSQRLAEDCAAHKVLEKLGSDIAHVEGFRGCYKQELEDYALLNEYTLTCHTYPVDVSVHLGTMYDCVVSSECLRGNIESFSVSSNPSGCESLQEAKESAARNALQLIGQEDIKS